MEDIKSRLLHLRAQHAEELEGMEFRHDKEIGDIQHSCTHEWMLGMGNDNHLKVFDTRYKQCQICDLVTYKQKGWQDE